MRNTKALLALLLVAVLLINIAPLQAVGNATFEVQTANAKAGESVDVAISVKNSPGITSTKLNVTFGDALTLTNVTYGTEITGNFVKPKKTTSPIILNWANGLEDFSGDYLFATLTFEVAANAEAGLCPITVTYDPDDVFNVEETNADFAIQNGGVQIEVPPVNVTGVSLNKSVLSLKTGEAETLIATISPDKATNKTVAWKSSDNDVAAVDNTGKVTAIKEGTATITATTEDGNFSASCTVSVDCSHTNKTETPSKSPDCVNPGNYKYYTCDACGDVFKADGVTETTVKAETIPALNHDFTERIEDAAHLVAGTGADCQHVKEYYYDCSRCNVMGNTTFASTTCGEHQMDTEWTTVNGEHYHKCTVSGCDHKTDKALCSGGTATCTEKAVCGTCGKEYGNLLEHNLTHHAGNEANHFRPGNIEYWTCDACGKYFSDASAKTEIQEEDIKIAQIPHSYSTSWSQSATQHWNECSCGDKINVYDHVYDNACDTTCNTCGYTRSTTHSWNTTYSYNGTQHWIECSTCHEKKEIASHTGGTATCQTKKECTICHQAYGELAECDFTAEVADNKYLGSEATCVAKAVYYKSCAVCGAASTETFECGTVNTANHVGGTYLDGKLDATCIAEGYTGDIKCNSCHAIITACSVVGKTDHVPSASWSTDGEYHWKTCQTTGCTETLEKAAHSGGTATCKDAAACTACGVNYGNKNADNHTGNTEQRDAKAATCTEAGYTGDTWCKDCNTKLATGEAIPAAHKLTHVAAKAATHTESGNIEYWSCDVCQKLYSNDKATTEVTAADVAIAAVGHTYGETYKHDADKHWKECSCGDKSEEAAHTYGEWVTTKKADVRAEGSKERTCSVCGYKQTEKTPATTTPATGDDTQIGLLFALLLVSACGMITMLFLVPQKKGKYQR